jgi:hypothetical protein
MNVGPCAKTSLGRDLDPGPLPYQGTTQIIPNQAMLGSGQALMPHPKILPIISSDELWTKFEAHLKHNMNSQSLKCRLAYAKKYLYVLNDKNAQDLLVLSPDK